MLMIFEKMQQSPVPDYETLSSRLKLLAHPERLRILDVLRRDAECVCHLEALLGKPQPYVSQQLRFLRQAGLIVDEKEGQLPPRRQRGDRLAQSTPWPSHG